MRPKNESAENHSGRDALCGYRRRSVGRILFSVFVFCSLTIAAAAEANKGIGPYEPEFGRTAPTNAYVAFCGRPEGTSECNFKGKAERMKFDSETWNLLVEVNSLVNTKIRPATDMELYGVPDYWTYPVDAGDCEDYVLLKKRYLTDKGIRADELLITVVLDENGDGHAVLSVTTEQGDYILDNRRADIIIVVLDPAQCTL